MKRKRWIIPAVLCALAAAAAAYYMLPGSERDEKADAYAPSGGEESQTVISATEKDDEIAVSWKGDRYGPQWIRYGKTGTGKKHWRVIKADREKLFKGAYFRYHAVLDDLKQGEEYSYETGDGESFSEEKSFKALERKGETEFLYLGDVQFDTSLRDYGRWGSMIKNVGKNHPELGFAVMGGDMVNDALKEDQWNSFFENTGLFSRIPLMAAPGNHEGAGSNRTYKKMFAMPENGPGEDSETRNRLKGDFFFFDWGYCRLVIMDSSFLTDKRRENMGRKAWERCEKAVEGWLEDVLKTGDERWLIVVIHHPPYGIHDEEVSRKIRDRWTPVMEKSGVHLVLCGHQHMYMRTRSINGIIYVMGNSGMRKSGYYNGYNGPFYSRSLYEKGPNYQIIKAGSDTLKLTSYDEKNLVIDEVSIEKRVTYFRIF